MAGPTDAQAPVTIRIVAGEVDGEPVLERIPAAPRGEGMFIVRGSPGLVEGIAAGDLIRLNEDHTFEVLERGGNLCVQVLADEFPEAETSELVSRVEALGGYLDGGSDGGTSRVRVFTIPVSAGFPAVEAAFQAFAESQPDCDWYFGNVYDEDGETPLNWW